MNADQNAARDQRVKTGRDVIAAMRALAIECRSTAEQANVSAGHVGQTVNTLATLTPAAIVMDPAGTLNTMRLLAAGALQSASVTASMAEQAAAAYEEMANEREAQLDALAAIEVDQALSDVLEQARKARPALVVNNASGEGGKPPAAKRDRKAK